MTDGHAGDAGSTPLVVDVASEPRTFEGGAVVVGVFEGGELSASARLLDRATDGLLQEVIDSGDMVGKNGTRALVRTHGRVATPRVLIAGLGKPEDVDAERLRRTSAETARHLRDLGVRAVGTTLHSATALDAAAAGEAIVEGAVLGLYRFSQYHTPDEEEPEKSLESLTILEREAATRNDLRAGSVRGHKRANGGNLARDLGNEPANVLPPLELARRAELLAQETGLSCRVLQGQELEDEGFRTLLAVGQGSVNPPAFIVIEHESEREEPPLVFVGKGICFDSGGLSLKPGGGPDMKLDMGGAAAVIGAMCAVAALEVPRKVTGLVAAAENMPSGTAQRPGDVIKALGGPTIEVLNTDAEGRLVLADALGYAEQLSPAAVVDLATLTGACVTALGEHTSGLFGRHDDDTDRLVERISASAVAVHERVWRLPLWEEYDEQIKGDVADVKNVGSGGAGAITAAAFLGKFAKEYPWVHLDIAGVMSYDADKGYNVKGASGYGARLLTHLAENWPDPE